jgi:flagellar FliL protein
MTVRSADGTDLADAGLGLIKRQILEKTNALLGKALLRAIVVSDFSYLEQ